MRRSISLAMLLGWAGCEPMTPSGQPFQPVTVSAPVPEAPPPSADPPGGFDFEAEDRQEPFALPPAAPLPPVFPDEALPPPIVEADVAAPSPPPADVSRTPRDLVSSFGMTLLNTQVGQQPPRANLASAGGDEYVVKAGTMLADEGLLVMAIGRDVVQVVRVSSEGQRAVVEPETLHAMYPEGSTAD